MMAVLRAVGFLCALFSSFEEATTMQSDDAYVRCEGSQWTIGTALVERTMTLENGRFLLRSFLNKNAGLEMVPPGTVGEEFSLAAGRDKVRISGRTGGWSLVKSDQMKLSHGELQLDITLRRDSLQVTKHYVVYPKTSIIREWLTFENVGDEPIEVVEPSFLDLLARPGEPASLDLHWITGGLSVKGSGQLRTEKLTLERRSFDSYDPFPFDDTAEDASFCDGVMARIMHNDRQVWPESGWQHVPNAASRPAFDVEVDIQEEDRLLFIVNMNRNLTCDTTAFDPTISYEDGESHAASEEFGGEQGAAGWRYCCIENGELVDLVYHRGIRQWRPEVVGPTGTPFIGAGDQHPQPGQDACRVWTTPRPGRVRVTGFVCNTGYAGPKPDTYSFRPGSWSYAPWYAIENRQEQSGLFIGWDYFGHWTSALDTAPGDTLTVSLRVAGHCQTLAPGESFRTPKAFVGLFRGDLDEAGNACLDWQYRYMWDYTREGWFPAIRMLGYWWKGTGWMQQQFTGYQDIPSATRKVFRVADLMRYCGADVYHRDWGWRDREGDWNGPDWRATGEYLRLQNMGQLIYMHINHAEPGSRPAREHPEWLLGVVMDMSIPDAVEHLGVQLDALRAQWGPFELRTDNAITCPRDGDDTPLLGQDRGFRALIKGFLDRHPDCAFQACNGGGMYLGYEYTSYSSCIQFTDGGAGLLSNFYAALLLPPDKTCHMPDSWDPDKYDKATWRGLLTLCFDMTGDTWDPDKLEGVRQLIDIYHYLHSQGVVGRWVKVYRPYVVGDDPTMYFQRLSRDRKRGIIITKHLVESPVTIRPKGLLPDEVYLVSFQECEETAERTGADLMANGVALSEVPPGELVYLNLPKHPGSPLDWLPPSAPSTVAKRLGEHLGYPGVEIAWEPGHDDNWVSYYEVFRNGFPIDKVAKGCFYFDHSVGAELAAVYEVRTVDGAGNVSSKAAAQGRRALPCAIYDDAQDDGLSFLGSWRLKTDLSPAHAGTIMSSNEKGATAKLEVEGSAVLVFSKLGPECGKAAISIDDSPPDIVDTYSADDIWGICIFRGKLPSPTRHVLTVEVLGHCIARASDAYVYVDGVRVEPRQALRRGTSDDDSESGSPKLAGDVAPAVLRRSRALQHHHRSGGQLLRKKRCGTSQAIR
ncbi:MAG TPA: hypothetical protein HPP83_02740 [Candidatus Hydrogenedentes bacterium]|nr:hypothetical protein [Candidatus Hydrogenedentota bacterium]